MRLMVVEDNKTSLLILTRLAEQVGGCEVASFADPTSAFAYATSEGCDLILVDYLMPDMNGVDFVRAVRAHARTADVPVIMITSAADRSVRQAAIDAGATDFLAKPVDPIELRARLRNLIALRQAMLSEKQRAEWLTCEVAAATKTIADREQETIMRMVRAIEFRDCVTGAHVDRIAHHSKLIGENLGLSEEENRELYLAAPMHDIGKLAVPDAILLKPGPLDEAERRVMQQHTVQGHAILAGSQAPLLRKAAEIALSHHERFDGRGYPHGWRGEAIPLSARIVAVADVFDALISDRPYKAAWSVERARAYLIDNSGSQFDPECVRAFLFDQSGCERPIDPLSRAA
jgi:putative two-component system response regulator